MYNITAMQHALMHLFFILHVLKDGHTFIVHGQKLHLKGSLLCMVGDTPAVALAGGFKEGVGFANKKCRHCMANNEQIQINVSVIYIHEK